jgi:hypothetical protein
MNTRYSETYSEILGILLTMYTTKRGFTKGAVHQTLSIISSFASNYAGLGISNSIVEDTSFF